MRYVLDTHIILAYLRKHSVWSLIDLRLKIFDPESIVFVPVMVIAELRSIAFQNKWGISKKKQLDIYLNEFVRIDKITNDIVNRYAEIDAYSQGKLDNKPFADSARNMGKNDLWIAAITSVLDATLITADNDFQHLHMQFLQVAYFDI